MARKRRFGQRGTWHFSDSGTKFDGRPRSTQRNNLKPISPALKRGIIHCSRCGSRIVSNVDHCPFCGRSLRPFFARFWFWLIVVVLVTIAVIWFINTNLPEETKSPSGPPTPERPLVIGSDGQQSLKNLALGTGINNSGLEVVVGAVSVGPTALNGSQIYIVEVEFTNTKSESVTLYSMQWMLETSEGTRLDTFVGSALDGATLTSNFEAYELQPQGRFSGRLYFALPASSSTADPNAEAGLTAVIPASVVYQPSALSYNEELLVTWKVDALFA